jgi:deoxyribonuclease-4
LRLAVQRALERECTTFQIFCGNPRAWDMGGRDAAEVEAFRAARKEAGLSPLFVHACYLINLCAPDPAVFDKSVHRMADELAASVEAGADCYVVHPGSHKMMSPAWGVARASEAIVRAADLVGRCPTLLLENTALSCGPGHSFRRLAEVIEAVRRSLPDLDIGIALDSCHAFVAGYDFRRRDGLQRLVQDISTTVGLSSVRLVHANDARDEAGSGRDRHWHIGQGTIGQFGLRNLLLQRDLCRVPVILETPWKGVAEDLQNIRRLRRIIGLQRREQNVT